MPFTSLLVGRLRGQSRLVSYQGRECRQSDPKRSFDGNTLAR